MIDSSTIEWVPLADYHGANHVLGAGCCFIHPANGNQYFWDCTQWDGARQDLNIYRLIAKTNAWEHIVKLEGTVNAERGFERGQVQIGQGGALIVGTTMIPKGMPHVTTQGFQGVRCRIPRIDDPWSMPDVTAITAQLAALQEQLTAQAEQLDAMRRIVEVQARRLDDLEALVDRVAAGLSFEQSDDLAWLHTARALLRDA